MLVFSGSSNGSLAKSLAVKLKTRLGKVELSRFANDEARVRVRENQLGEKAVVVQSLSQPTDHNLVELLLITDALRRLGIKEIIGVIPWMGYSKQDKVFRKGEPLSMAVVAKILDGVGFKKMITFDLHNPQSIKFFKTRLINLSARSLMVEYFKKQMDEETVVVAPDSGGRGLSERFARDLGAAVAYLDKERDLNTGQVTIKGIKGEVENKKVLMIDDIMATGGTLIEAAKYLRAKGVQSIKVGVTHHLYVPEVQKKIDRSPINKLVVTDTIEQRVKSKKLGFLKVASLMASEIGD
jgi:ribose-phosphate pyrophosphokinase